MCMISRFSSGRWDVDVIQERLSTHSQKIYNTFGTTGQTPKTVNNNNKKNTVKPPVHGSISGRYSWLLYLATASALDSAGIPPK